MKATPFRFGLVLVLCALSCGCQYEYRAGASQRTDSDRSRLTEASSLGRRLRPAFQGDRTAAWAYSGVYQVLADCVADPRFGWKKPADIERDVVVVRDLLDLRHQQFPEVTRIVTESLDPLKENSELTTESRQKWRQALRDLAQGCREAAR